MSAGIAAVSIYDSRGTQAFSSDPFPHFTWTNVYTDEMAALLLEWLTRAPQWATRKQSNWQASAFPVNPARVPDAVRPVFSGQNLGALRQRLESAYRRPLSPAISVEAFRHGPGDQTSIHTDFRRGAVRFTHRLITYFSDGPHENRGGDLRLFRETDEGPELAHVYAPVHNTAASLEFGPASLHQVAPVTAGLRYSLVWSFSPTSTPVVVRPKIPVG